MMNRFGVLVALALVAAQASSILASDDSPRHLIYLHGRIVQLEQDARPVHPRFGAYELEQILAAFRVGGYVVTGEIRPKSASESESADHVATQIRKLLESGVPADHITVVGASAGGGIALTASARLQQPDIRFAILGNCLTDLARRVQAAEEKDLSGRILSIREASDDVTRGCQPWADNAEESPHSASELIIDTGLSHGFLYRPMPDWLEPVLQFLSEKR